MYIDCHSLHGYILCVATSTGVYTQKSHQLNISLLTYNWYHYSHTTEAVPDDNTDVYVWDGNSRSPKKVGSLHASWGDLSCFVYGHLNSAMPLQQMQEGSNTLASGDAPSHPFVWWMIKPHRCVVRPLWPLLTINSLYLLQATSSFCRPQAIGGGRGSNRGFGYRHRQRRATDFFFWIRIWPQIEEVMRWARTWYHSSVLDCFVVLSSILWRRAVLTQELFFLSVISSGLSVRAVYVSWSFDGVTSMDADGVSATLLDFLWIWNQHMEESTWLI